MIKIACSMLALTACVLAQDNPLSSAIKTQYVMSKTMISRTADKVPEAEYPFKPNDSVRSLGQILGHVADDQYVFCSAILGEKSPEPGVEKSKTSKADLVNALKDAFAYCDKAYDSMTDATAAQMVKFFGRETPRLSVLTFNNMHNFEHYGNLITYMRIRNIVPPSSEPRPQQKK